MSTQAKTKSRIQGTKIQIVRDTNCLFKEAIVNTKSKKKYLSTPLSSKDSGKQNQFRKLEFPIAEAPVRRFSNILINIQFSTSTTSINLKLIKTTVDKPSGIMAPYVFSGSDELLIPKIEKTSNHPLGPRLAKLSSDVDLGSDVGSITKTLTDLRLEQQQKNALRLERHKNMFKSRYARNNRCDKAYVGGIRINRRFDLLMKHREDQLAASRVTFV